MSFTNPQGLINRIDDCEQKLLNILDKFERLAQASVNMYENSLRETVPKVEEGDNIEEIQNVAEDETGSLTKETDELAHQIRVFGGNLMGVLGSLPNDEPIKPNEGEFDAFLLDFTEKFILKKIKAIEDLVNPKKPAFPSRRSY